MCGIIAIHSKDNSVGLETLISALKNLSNRGEDSFGAMGINPENTEKPHSLIKLPGVMDERGKEAVYAILDGKQTFFLGQTRYSTSAKSKDPVERDRNAQPIILFKGGIDCAENFGALLHNGNIPPGNLEKIIRRIDDLSDSQATSDSRYLGEYFRGLVKKHPPFVAGKKFMETVNGAYSFIYTDFNNLYILRDPWGIRPLSMGKVKGELVFASENGQFSALGLDYIRDVQRGEMLIVDKEGRVLSEQIIPLDDQRFSEKYCFFERIYFQKRFGFDERRNVSNESLRQECGKIVAEFYRDVFGNIDLMLPSLDSGLSVTHGITYITHLPCSHALTKNKSLRFFMLPEGERNHEFIADSHQIRNKRVGVGDDSLVRGDTIVEMYKTLIIAGAEEVHLFLGCPPIVFPCDLGIDTPTEQELLANRLYHEGIIKYEGSRLTYNVHEVNRRATELVQEKIREKYPGLNADRLHIYYIPLRNKEPYGRGLEEIFPSNSYCKRCIDGVDPFQKL